MNHSRYSFLPFDETNIEDPSVSANQEEINESAKSRARCLEIIRRESENLEGIEACLDENFLLRFLRVSKFDASKALERLKKYYKHNDVILDAFSDIALSFQKAQNIKPYRLSPYRMKDNSLLLVGEKRRIDYRQITFAERLYTEIMMFNKLLENPVNQICGFTFIIDCEGFGVLDLAAFTPGWVRLFTDTLLNVFPCRIKAVCVVSAPAPVSIVYKLVYTFLSKKIRDRISFHSGKDNWRSLHDLIPVDILPEMYGGKVKDDKLINCLENKEELDMKFRKLFAFGYSKTKQRRQSMRVLY